MLAGLDPVWTASRYGPDTFSPFDVVGHLIEGEKSDWIPRLRLILTAGESEPFKPFERYAMFRNSAGRSIDELLEEFAVVRSASLSELRALSLTNADLQRTGRHPEFGRVTAAQLLATWVAHDLNHTHQVAKCMAWQYREAIGPWQAYLGVYRS
jgi:hypothetical protein